MSKKEESNIEEIAKHRKKRESSTSKSRRKSKHKHTYKPCLLKMNDSKYFQNHWIYGTSYCTICGKIGGKMIEDAIRIDNGCWRQLTNEELLEKYKGHPIFDVDDIFQEYVPLVKEEK